MKKTNAQVIEPHEVSLMTQGTFDFLTVTETAVRFKGQISINDWLQVAISGWEHLAGLKRGREALLLKMGDVLRYGDEQFGEEAAQAFPTESECATMGISEKTVKNLAWIARSVPEDNRIRGLTTSHYETVAKLDPKTQLAHLKAASEENMSVKQLSQKVAISELTESEIAEIDKRLPDEKTVEHLSAAQIRKMKKRIASGEEEPKEKNTVIIDADAEEGIRHGADVVADWLRDNARDYSDWTPERKQTWECLNDIAGIVRPVAGKLKQPADARKAAKNLGEWLTNHVEDLGEDFEEVLKPIYRIFRRRWMNGHAKK